MIYISIIIITVIMSAFFSGIEMAFVSSDKFQIELDKNKNNLYSKLITKIIEKPKQFIASMLLGNNISLVIYGIYTGKLISNLLIYFSLLNNDIIYSIWGLFLQTCISTLIILFTAEFLPKLIFRLYAYETLNFFIIPTYLIFKILSPITIFIIKISNWFLSFIGYKENNKTKIFDRDDLDLFISKKIEDEENLNIEPEIKIFHKALDFSEIKSRECMVPRKEIIAIDMNNINLYFINKTFTNSGFSKIIVYKNNIDNIIGYIHYLELLKKPNNIYSILFPVEFIYETVPAKVVMNLLINKRKSVAIVLDEYGGTSGLITIEDILEELLGNIEDEHDKNEYIEKKINNNEFIFSARLEIDYINNQYNINLPTSDDYETLGGLIVSHTEEIPKKGKILKLKNFKFEVKKVSKNKIEEVLLII